MSEKTDREECIRLYEDLSEASIEKDEEWMSRLLADDYVLVHMTGMAQSKNDFIAAVMDGTLNYFGASHDKIEARVSEDGAHAHITGMSRVDAAVFGGGRHTWPLKQDMEAERRDGRWLITTSTASMY